jgi:hypothetical protein
MDSELTVVTLSDSNSGSAKGVLWPPRLMKRMPTWRLA